MCKKNIWEYQNSAEKKKQSSDGTVHTTHTRCYLFTINTNVNSQRGIQLNDQLIQSHMRLFSI